MTGKTMNERFARSAVWILLPLVFFGIGYAMHRMQLSPMPTSKNVVENERVPESEKSTVAPEPRPRPSIDDITSASPGKLPKTLALFLKSASGAELQQLAEALGFQKERMPYYLWELVLMRWLIVDPEQAMAAAVKLKMETDLVLHWAKHDLPQAVGYARKDPHMLLPGLMDSIAEKDLSLAVSLMDEFPFLGSNSGAVFERLAETDPEAALARAMGFRDAYARERALYSAIDGWMKKNMVSDS